MVRTSSRRWPRRSMPGRARRSAGERPPRHLTGCYDRFTPALRRPVEPRRYLAITYTERLAEAGIAPSVGGVGDSYDSALAETVIGLLKAEVIRRRPGPWRSLEAVEWASLAWIDWFNHRRLLEPIGNIPPAEAEERYSATPEEAALAA